MHNFPTCTSSAKDPMAYCGIYPARITARVAEWTIFTKRGSGGIMADVCLFLARPYVFCVLFLYSRSVKEARLRFSNTALPN